MKKAFFGIVFLFTATPTFAQNSIDVGEFISRLSNLLLLREQLVNYDPMVEYSSSAVFDRVKNLSAESAAWTKACPERANHDPPLLTFEAQWKDAVATTSGYPADLQPEPSHIARYHDLAGLSCDDLEELLASQYDTKNGYSEEVKAIQLELQAFAGWKLAIHSVEREIRLNFQKMHKNSR